MTNSGWNPWKATTIGLLISIGVALVTGLVVANWTGPRPDAVGPWRKVRRWRRPRRRAHR